MSLLQMSISGGLLVLFIIAVRKIGIKRLGKSIFVFLWSLVLLRLFIPFSVPLNFNLWYIFTKDFSENSAGKSTQMIINNIPDQSKSSSGSFWEKINFTHVFWIVWITGCVFLVLYFLVVYLKNMREFKMSLPVEEPFISDWLSDIPLKRQIQIRRSDQIRSPLTYGIIRPVILLPSDIEWSSREQLEVILTHEYIHIRNYDSVMKILLTAAVCLHWFNPLVWLMYKFAGQDIEIRCDESSIHMLGSEKRTFYAKTLIRMEEHKAGRLMPVYSNFCECAAEERIVLIMKRRKSSVTGAVIVIAFMICSMSVLAAKNPADKADAEDVKTSQIETVQTDGQSSKSGQSDKQINTDEENANGSVTVTNDGAGEGYIFIETAQTDESEVNVEIGENGEEEFSKLLTTDETEEWIEEQLADVEKRLQNGEITEEEAKEQKEQFHDIKEHLLDSSFNMRKSENAVYVTW